MFFSVVMFVFVVVDDDDNNDEILCFVTMYLFVAVAVVFVVL